MARPTGYRTEYAKQARKLCLLGATDAELADFFEVNQSTITRWKQRYPAFRTSLKAGKLDADANVTDRLYRRAMGYSHKAVKINLFAGEAIITPYTEHYPPDTTACIFWLKNRRPADWRDRPADEAPADAAEIARKVREAVGAIMDADGLRVA